MEKLSNLTRQKSRSDSEIRSTSPHIETSINASEDENSGENHYQKPKVQTEFVVPIDEELFVPQVCESNNLNSMNPTFYIPGDQGDANYEEIHNKSELDCLGLSENEEKPPKVETETKKSSKIRRVFQSIVRKVMVTDEEDEGDYIDSGGRGSLSRSYGRYRVDEEIRRQRKEKRDRFMRRLSVENPDKESKYSREKNNIDGKYFYQEGLVIEDVKVYWPEDKQNRIIKVIRVEYGKSNEFLANKTLRKIERNVVDSHNREDVSKRYNLLNMVKRSQRTDELLEKKRKEEEMVENFRQFMSFKQMVAGENDYQISVDKTKRTDELLEKKRKEEEMVENFRQFMSFKQMVAGENDYQISVDKTKRRSSFYDILPCLKRSSRSSSTEKRKTEGEKSFANEIYQGIKYGIEATLDANSEEEEEEIERRYSSKKVRRRNRNTRQREQKSSNGGDEESLNFAKVVLEAADIAKEIIND